MLCCLLRQEVLWQLRYSHATGCAQTERTGKRRKWGQKQWQTSARKHKTSSLYLSFKGKTCSFAFWVLGAKPSVNATEMKSRWKRVLRRILPKGACMCFLSGCTPDVYFFLFFYINSAQLVKWSSHYELSASHKRHLSEPWSNINELIHIYIFCRMDRWA